MRVQVPEDTDLSHYFEIMSNRGEQLEKHEVFKALLLEKFNGIEDGVERTESQNCLRVVWEVCANIERYVQTEFTGRQRSIIFTGPDGRPSMGHNSDALRNALSPSGDNGSEPPDDCSLDEIINREGKNKADDNSGKTGIDERFGTIINFPNFLLHVLRVQAGSTISLDDKRLIETFKSHVLDQCSAIAEVKKFAVNLLRCKYLYDHFLLKREAFKDTGRWSLKRYELNDTISRNYPGIPSFLSS